MESRYVVIDNHGGNRLVGHPRMTLDGIVYAFRDSDSPESIRSQWPFLSLEEVFGCITYYLAHKQEVDEYLERQEKLWEKLKEEAEADANPDPVSLRLRKLKKDLAARDA